jgi:long-chain acyl-CoA synthetase
MLIGESKPYVSAIAWIEKKHYDQVTLELKDKAMVEMNKNLSNPEKVKRWALLINNLSIENGELTPNLKLKRLVICQKYANVIDALYSGATPEGVHIAGVEKPGE